MDINEIKKLIKNSTALLVMDDSKPSFVILDYETYKSLIENRESDEKDVRINSPANGSDGIRPAEKDNNRNDETEILDRLNKDILALRNQIESEERTTNKSSSID